jgi:hypothetical protein
VPALPYPFPDPTTGNWDAYALLANLRYLMSLLTAHSGNLVPTGSILMIRSGGTCPAGYTRVTDAAVAGRYLRVNVTAAGGTGGSLNVTITDPGHSHASGYTIQDAGAHTHVTTISGTHTHLMTGPTSTVLITSAAVGTTLHVASSTHFHTVTAFGAHTHTALSSGLHAHTLGGSSGASVTGITGTIAPAYLDIILCQKS